MTRHCIDYVLVHLCKAFKHNKTCFKNLSILLVICVLNGRLWLIQYRSKSQPKHLEVSNNFVSNLE